MPLACPEKENGADSAITREKTPIKASMRSRNKMNAPTDGWVAIGFNTQDQLAGTNLIMGCVKSGKTIVEDRHTVRPGHYPTVVELGGTSAVSETSGLENDHYTTISFTIPLKAVDQYHHDLEPGNEYTVLMAYSREDDFLHHSIMRTSVQLKL